MAHDIDTITPPSRRQTESTTQATAIEQSRAVAEVQAAVVVAQQVPRDMGAAEADMREACAKTGLARRAFYSVVNRGSGPSVHLARELARIFGNVQYGVHELRRDDTLGMSEIQAFAWDVEKNVRSTRTFQVPHQRMKKVQGVPTRDPLVDLTDVYLNNQNIGARAVRECIFTVLPAWFTDAAQDLCHKTITDGEGEPLVDRVANMVRLFGELDVTEAQLVDKIGRARSAWRPVDLAQMTIVYQSITRGEITKDDAFPSRRITAADVLGEDQQVVRPDTGVVSTGEQPAPESPGHNPAEDLPADVTPQTSSTISPAEDSGSTDDRPTPETAQAPATPQREDSSGEPSAAPAPDRPAEEASSGKAAAAEVETGRATGPRMSVTQRTELLAQFNRLDVDDQDERLWWVNHLLGLDPGTIGHPAEIRQPEAVRLIAILSEQFTSRDQLDASLSQDQLPNE